MTGISGLKGWRRHAAYAVLGLWATAPFAGNGATQQRACGALDLAVARLEPPPMQYRQFCEANPGHCILTGEFVLEWTKETAAAVEAVNHEVNTEIRFEPDWEWLGIEDLWCYPTAGVGDCEDFALEKRRRLVALGFPGAALTMAIVHHRECFFAHAVLLAETTAGTLVLDNLDDALHCWDAAPYRYERREGLDGRWIRYERPR